MLSLIGPAFKLSGPEGARLRMTDRRSPATLSSIFIGRGAPNDAKARYPTLHTPKALLPIGSKLADCSSLLRRVEGEDVDINMRRLGHGVEDCRGNVLALELDHVAQPLIDRCTDFVAHVRGKLRPDRTRLD